MILENGKITRKYLLFLNMKSNKKDLTSNTTVKRSCVTNIPKANFSLLFKVCIHHQIIRIFLLNLIFFSNILFFNFSSLFLFELSSTLTEKFELERTICISL